MARFVCVTGLVGSICLFGCASRVPSEDRSLSLFAQKVQQQLEVATDPAAVEQNELSTRDLTRCVEQLHQRRSLLQAKVDSPEAPRQTLTRERIELVRIERQLQMIERLLTRYERNAPAVASGQ